MKRIVVAFLLLVLPLSGGCLGGVPLDRYCYVLDLGVERGDSMPYRFVFLLNEDTAGSGEDGGNRGEVSMVCAEERSLFAAIDALSGALPAQLSFERTTLLAFSRELAEAGEMEAVMAGALSRLKIRQNVRVIVVEEDMRRAFQGLVSEGDPSMNRLKTNVKLFEENFGYVEDWGLSRVREAFSNDTGDALLPYAGLVGGPLQPDMVGGQVYPYLGGGLLGEGMLVLMAKGTFQTGHLRLPWKGTELDMALYVVGKPKRSWQAGTFTCEITLEADLEHPAQVEVMGGKAAAEVQVLLFGDDVILGDRPVTAQLCEAYEKYGNPELLAEVRTAINSKASSVDLSKDKYFPEIGNQGGIGSCVQWSVCYYNLGYRINRMYDRAAANDNRLQPLFTHVLQANEDSMFSVGVPTYGTCPDTDNNKTLTC